MARRKDAIWWMLFATFLVGAIGVRAVRASAPLQAGEDAVSQRAVQGNLPPPPDLPFQAADTVMMVLCCA